MSVDLGNSVEGKLSFHEFEILLCSLRCGY